MTSKTGPSHVVVDGSNIATEGRSVPSLAQLSDAVASFMDEHPETAITVVVDATFGHRIEKKEVAEFEAGISNNELVAPPAGAIGRGDAFVLSIAQKANASILSNDSFQEFHADYEWLFDEGRLIGGKPVPHVGWVFVNRSPVRGPVSRKATQGARGGRTRGGSKRSDTDRGVVALGSGSPLANEPMPVPKSPPPGRSKAAPRERPAAAPSNSSSPPPAPRAGDVVNELMPFLEFVEHHPIGTSVNGIVETYSSHGAYIAIGTDGVRGYIPLRLMADPAPTSARKVMQIGEAVTVVVVSFAAARRSIDCALPDMAEHPQATAAPADDAPVRTARRGRARTETMVAEAVIEQLGGEIVDAAPEKATPKRRGTRKAPAASAVAEPTAVAQPVTEQAADRDDVDRAESVATSPTKRSASKAAPKRAATKPAAKRAASTTAAAEPAVETSATKAPAAKKSATKKSSAATTPARNGTARKAPAARKSAAKASPTKAPAAVDAPASKPAPAAKAPATKQPRAAKAPATKAPAAKASAKKAPATKAPAKKAPAKRAAAKKAPASTSPAVQAD